MLDLALYLKQAFLGVQIAQVRYTNTNMTSKL